MSSVYQVLCYFDVFDYPVTCSEIVKYCSEEMDERTATLSLEELIRIEKIHYQRGYYYLAASSAGCIEKRLAGEKLLAKKLSTIKKYAKLVSGFPFVRAAFISGSVSKGVLSATGDVDYFIVSEKGRVWICRTLLILFKKIVLLNSKKYFCVNYFVDSGGMNVPDSNLFVATEIKTLVPVFTNETALEFISKNDWIDKMFPNSKGINPALLIQEKNKPVLSKLIETLFSSGLGERVDDYFFKKTLLRWRKKFPHFDQSQFDLNMRSYKSVSKHHPQGNQSKVLNGLELRMSQLHS